jgi:hypothetical protein
VAFESEVEQYFGLLFKFSFSETIYKTRLD